MLISQTEGYFENPWYHFLEEPTQQTFVFMETSWRRLLSSSSEGVFKTSSRRLDQSEYICLSHTSSEDVLIKTKIFVLAIRLAKTSLRNLQGVFKTFWRRLQDILPRRFQNVLQKRLQNVFKTFWRRLQDVWQRCLQDVFKTYHQVKQFP